jgi:hypothetical protein
MQQWQKRIWGMTRDNYPADRKATIAAEFARLSNNDRHRANVRLLEDVFSPLTQSDMPAHLTANGTSESLGPDASTSDRSD